jgi:hypothetical protein
MLQRRSLVFTLQSLTFIVKADLSIYLSYPEGLVFTLKIMGVADFDETLKNLRFFQSA